MLKLPKKYSSKLKLINSILILLVNIFFLIAGFIWVYKAAGDPFYKKFPPENQKIIFNAASEAAIYQNSLMEKYEAEYRKNLMEFGSEFIEVDREAFEELAMEVIPPFFEGKWKSGIFDRIQINNNY